MSLLKQKTTEGAHDFEVLLSEVGSISREAVVVASGQKLLPGTVLGVVTASSEYAIHDPDETDGTKDAVAVLLTGTDATSAAAKAVICARLAEVKTDLLVFKTGISAPDKTAALSALAAKNIIAR